MKPIKTLLLTASIVVLGLFASRAQGGITFTNLYQPRKNVNDPVGWEPNGLCKASDGNFYGTTLYGGTNGPGGTIFKMTADGTLTFLAGFGGVGSPLGPASALIQGADGNLYGTTQSGGSNLYGAVFQAMTNGLVNTLFSFYYSTGCNCEPDGEAPTSPLVQGKDGNFYGMTQSGGTGASHNYGVVFCVTTNQTLTNIVSFSGANGGGPWDSGLVLGADGNFYGTTRNGGSTYNFSGGTLGDGTVFQLTTNGILTTLVSFYGANGQEPMSGVVLGKDGNFYGTTRIGGQYGNGTVFQLQVNGSTAFLNTLHSFTDPVPSGDVGTNTDGTQPQGGLLVGADGNLYGTTETSGANGFGTIFQIQTNGTLTTLYSFTGGNDGANPGSAGQAMVQGDDGSFYGTTYTGGTHGVGTIFRLSITPSPPVFQSETLSNGLLTLTWGSISNQMYQLEYCTNVAEASWTYLGSSITATNTTATAIETIGPDLQQFYRVVLLP